MMHKKLRKTVDLLWNLLPPFTEETQIKAAFFGMASSRQDMTRRRAKGRSQKNDAAFLWTLIYHWGYLLSFQLFSPADCVTKYCVSFQRKLIPNMNITNQSNYSNSSNKLKMFFNICFQDRY